MKSGILFSLMVAASGTLVAQTPVNKSIPVAAGQTIDMHFDYPNVVRVSTWEKNEISVQGTVSINGGENDAAFELETSSAGKTIGISNHIRNMKNLPHRITVVRDGTKISFKSQADYEKYKAENGSGYNIRSDGVEMEITLEIKVPKGVPTKVESVYGMVEVIDFNAPLKVNATYGGVDASVAERSTGELSAETNYGQIYSNLDVKFGNGNLREENFHTYVYAKPGTGPSYVFDSRYGNVYLRKPVTQ